MVVQDERETTLLKIGLVQLIIVALLVFSLMSHQKNLTVLLLVLLAFVYGARLWSRFSLLNLTADSTFDRARIFPGEAVRLTIRADNRKALPVWLRVAVPVPGELLDDPAITSSARAAASFCPHQTRSFRQPRRKESGGRSGLSSRHQGLSGRPAFAVHPLDRQRQNEPIAGASLRTIASGEGAVCPRCGTLCCGKCRKPFRADPGRSGIPGSGV
jgi:uncharacterized protein (DUF58 family)